MEGIGLFYRNLGWEMTSLYPGSKNLDAAFANLVYLADATKTGSQVPTAGKPLSAHCS